MGDANIGLKQSRQALSCPWNDSKEWDGAWTSCSFDGLIVGAVVKKLPFTESGLPSTDFFKFYRQVVWYFMCINDKDRMIEKLNVLVNKKLTIKLDKASSHRFWQHCQCSQNRSVQLVKTKLSKILVKTPKVVNSCQLFLTYRWGYDTFDWR